MRLQAVLTQHEARELLKPAAGPETYVGASAFGLDSVGGCDQIQNHSGIDLIDRLARCAGPLDSTSGLELEA